jgi:CoA:oxalate CoA-transferase
VAAAATLTGVRVVDLSHGLAGPAAARLLAELGADVIKVEMVGGEFTREVVPYVFRSHNRGKRSLAVDLHDPRGAECVRRLAAISDVFIHNQRPGFVEEVGLDRDTLGTLNPRLIYAAITGFGRTGPDSSRRAIDMLIQAESGLASAQSALLGNVSFIDSSAGLSLATGILAALLERAASGRARSVDVSLLDTALYLQSGPLAEFSATGVSIDQTSYWPRYATVGSFDAEDGPVFVAGYWNRDWQAICDLIGCSELGRDERYVDPAARSAHAADVRRIINEGFSSWPREKLVAGLRDHGVIAGLVRSFQDVLDSPQVAANDSFSVEGEGSARTLFARPPFRIGYDEPTDVGPAPAVGGGTRDILAAIDLSPAEIDALLAARVVEAPDIEPTP